MALQTFTWSPLNGPQADFSYNTRTTQYGDGYAQTVDDGINPESQSWPLTFTATTVEILPIVKFLRAHGQSKTFKWTNPLGELGLYRATDLKITPLDFARMTVTVTFVTAYRAEEI